jgi:hypothetical protein
MNIDNLILSALIGALSAFITAIVTNCFQYFKENNIWLKNQLQNSYVDSIKGLSTLITLSAIPKGNVDIIEQSLVEAKKGLALSIVFMKKDRFADTHKKLKNEILLFISGDYKNLIKLYENQGIQPSERFKDAKIQNYEMYGSAEIILKRIIEAASYDKRLH